MTGPDTWLVGMLCKCQPHRGPGRLRWQGQHLTQMNVSFRSHHRATDRIKAHKIWLTLLTIFRLYANKWLLLQGLEPESLLVREFLAPLLEAKLAAPLRAEGRTAPPSARLSPRDTHAPAQLLQTLTVMPHAHRLHTGCTWTAFCTKFSPVPNMPGLHAFHLKDALSSAWDAQHPSSYLLYVYEAYILIQYL